jgi:hypothetical protein
MNQIFKVLLKKWVLLTGKKFLVICLLTKLRYQLSQILLIHQIKVWVLESQIQNGLPSGNKQTLKLKHGFKVGKEKKITD